MKNYIIRINAIWLVLIVLLLVSGITACQPTDNANPPVAEDNQTADAQDTQLEQPTSNEAESELMEGDAGDAPSSDVAEPEPVSIDEAWSSSSHANTFVVDSEGTNNPCARCHAPANWSPSIEDLPESCFTCKFEVKDPPAYISEDEWEGIPCKVCHQLDKKDNVQAEISWLEIAALDEYTSVATPTELCMKCHGQMNVPEHATVQVGGAHEGYECTECHNAHDATASCGTSDCHADVIEPDTPIKGHDQDHINVSCAACHDAGGLEVGPNEELGYWITYLPWTYETENDTETGIVAFTSHNLVLEASCERCHFADNPWGLSDNVNAP